MARIIAIANQKGGVAKTTTAVNLSACLVEHGKRVLLLDLDPQGNASSGCGINKNKLEKSIYDVLINEVPLEKIIMKTEIPGLLIAPARIELAGAEIELVGLEKREGKLVSALAKVKDEYDFIIIDCPPSLGLLTLNALTASTDVLIPVQCEYYALEGLTLLMDTIHRVKRNLNPNLNILGALLTMFDARTNLGIQVVDEVKKYFKQKVFSTIVPRNVRLGEAPSHGKPIVLYDSRSRGAEVYRDLAEEVLERV
ncbi:ATPase involved in chromosome partitioning [Desulfitobacterium dichloroeliminans LMG P-21439]|uniref:Sporulation initiation inhibitor protein Soj n=1 Tax=Desulfitobacterium dichloroeliminans (strain LMG P-21439 / DCA1) TaxID=871963 RepID=L0FE31_DESDL|nr:AAA family ATPase [Desulfitobacterium dichloroeliminans]AGA70911.1 ATPase involved in chromosome partitioning [Desulfitobacterium dichloroeliminans LMG P-21439]